MYQFDYKKRVRYSETDKMGYLYYGNYAALYEIGRVETIRSLGVSYQTLEDTHGIMLPVLSLESRFKMPAKYDEELIIRTTLKDMPGKMITFHHDIINEENQSINQAVVKLFFIDIATNKRISVPIFIKEKLEKHFE
jgi:acyl-CoA thioester hydrolase